MTRTIQSSQLAKRMAKYLLAKKDWVSKKKLIGLAKAQGYTYYVIQDAICELEDEVFTGVDFVGRNDRDERPYGAYLRCYPMDEETQKRRRKMLDEFDSLEEYYGPTKQEVSN